MTGPLFPDDDPENDESDHEEQDNDETAHKAVFVSTAIPVPLAISALDDSRAPEGSVLGSYIGDRLVARCAMPREAIERLMALNLFETPVPLALLAVEDAPGLQCRLFALIPTDKLSELEGEGGNEPWRASVPSYEERVAAAGDGDEEDAGDEVGDEDHDGDNDDDSSEVASILLGHVVRFTADRKFADDLTAEAVDVLQKIVLGGPLSDAASKKAIDDLLESI